MLSKIIAVSGEKLILKPAYPGILQVPVNKWNDVKLREIFPFDARICSVWTHSDDGTIFSGGLLNWLSEQRFSFVATATVDIDGVDDRYARGIYLQDMYNRFKQPRWKLFRAQDTPETADIYNAMLGLKTLDEFYLRRKEYPELMSVLEMDKWGFYSRLANCLQDPAKLVKIREFLLEQFPERAVEQAIRLKRLKETLTKLLDIKYVMRRAEDQQNARVSGHGDKHYIWDIKMPVLKAAYRENGMLASYSTEFAPPTDKDRAYIKDFFAQHPVDVLTLATPDSSHPQHRFITKTVLQTVHELYPRIKIVFFSSWLEKCKSGMPDNLVLYYTDSQVENVWRQIAQANPSQNSRHNDRHFYSLYYLNQTEAVAGYYPFERFWFAESFQVMEFVNP